MEISSISLDGKGSLSRPRRRPEFWLVLLLAAFGLTACATPGRHQEGGGASSPGATGTVGASPSPTIVPELTEPAPSPSALPGPVTVPTASVPRGVQMVWVGRGLDGFAAVGAYRALQKARIAVTGVGGAEAGAWVAALAAGGRSANAVEWQALKLDPDWFRPDRSALIPEALARSSRSRKLESLLRDALGDLRAEKARIPLVVVAQREDSAGPEALESGLLSELVRGSLADPATFGSAEVEGRSYRSAVLPDAAALVALRALRARNPADPVIIMGDAGLTEEARFHAEGAALVLRRRPAATAAEPLKERSAAIASGRSLVQGALPEIRKLLP